jgi:hypothetical protein
MKTGLPSTAQGGGGGGSKHGGHEGHFGYNQSNMMQRGTPSAMAGYSSLPGYSASIYHSIHEYWV